MRLSDRWHSLCLEASRQSRIDCNYWLNRTKGGEMKRSFAILGTVLGALSFAAQAGPLTLTFLGNGVGSISLPDDTLITTGSLSITHAMDSPMPPGYAAQGSATLYVYASAPGGPITPVGTPVVVVAPGLDQVTYWKISLSYLNGIAYGGFYSKVIPGLGLSEMDFGGINSGGTSTSGNSFCCYARGDIGNSWSVSNQVPIAPTVFLLGVGLVGIGAARRKKA